MKARIARSINRPPQAVFDYVTDPTNNAGWQGPTELTFDTESELSGPFRFAEGLIVKQLKKQLETDFDALKQALEAEQR